MRKTAHENSQLKHRLYESKRKLKKGERYVVMHLSREQAEYAVNHCGVEPYLYKVFKTFRLGYKPGKETKNAVKRIYYKKGNPVFVVLKASEVEACKAVGLNPIPHKYKVYVAELK